MTPKPSEIMARVCQRYGVAQPALMGDARVKPLPQARAVCAALARRFTTMSFPDIAEWLGYQSHSACIVASRRADVDAVEFIALSLTA